MNLKPLFKNLKDGEYILKDDSPEGLCYFQFEQELESDVWYIQHNNNSINVTVQILNEDEELIIPDKLIIVDENNIRIEFCSEIKGFANVFTVGHSDCFIYNT